eukprot:COSAG01_NODE_405_length_17466_cov_554.403697_26_plen_232_part_00
MLTAHTVAVRQLASWVCAAVVYAGAAASAAAAAAAGGEGASSSPGQWGRLLQLSNGAGIDGRSSSSWSGDLSTEVTGMCHGNTNSSGDVACPAGFEQRQPNHRCDVGGRCDIVACCVQPPPPTPPAPSTTVPATFQLQGGAVSLAAFSGTLVLRLPSGSSVSVQRFTQTATGELALQGVASSELSLAQQTQIRRGCARRRRALSRRLLPLGGRALPLGCCANAPPPPPHPV